MYFIYDGKNEVGSGECMCIAVQVKKIYMLILNVGIIIYSKSCIFINSQSICRTYKSFSNNVFNIRRSN